MRSRLYWVWSDMLSRCRNPKHKAWANYGARGIGVVEEWRAFDAFRTWAEESGYQPGLTLDRRDNDGPYSPANCRWATRQEQNSNRRNCIMVECDGERVTLKEACRRRGLQYRPVVKRIQDRGWPVALALNTPIGAPTRFLRRQGVAQ